MFAAMNQAELVATAVISRAEIAAALAKGVRIGALKKDAAFALLILFRKEWPNLSRLDLNENIVARADALAWEHRLRGFDSVHLACALMWQEAMDQPVTLATYDQALWRVAQRVGLISFPENLVQEKE